ncbi:hypothetical protein [Bacillus sp. FJAT-44742]|uniref:hypothetical protein n=1 Tax=Bacillus sp. FJAT-44742 TaxID=2014005 RepID=UPI0018E27390|nr:hypothetical protein [Bacillus sp. FJAT-44742]
MSVVNITEQFIKVQREMEQASLLTEVVFGTFHINLKEQNFKVIICNKARTLRVEHGRSSMALEEERNQFKGNNDDRKALEVLVEVLEVNEITSLVENGSLLLDFIDIQEYKAVKEQAYAENLPIEVFLKKKKVNEFVIGLLEIRAKYRELHRVTEISEYKRREEKVFHYIKKIEQKAKQQFAH